MLNNSIKAAAIATLLFSVCATANAQSLKTSINLSDVPEQVAVNYVTNRIYVPVSSFGGPTDTLTIIDGKTDSILTTMVIPPVAGNVAIDVLRNRIYLGGCPQDANGTSNCKVVALDGKTNTILATIPITSAAGNGIQGLAVNPINGTLYVSNASDNLIDVITLNSATVSSTISVGGEIPAMLTVNPFTCQLLVAIQGSQIQVIDTIKNVVTSTATIGRSNQGIAVNWKTGNIFVTDNVYGKSTTGVLDKTGKVLANVKVGNTPFGVDVDPFTNLAFVTNTQDNTISVIDGKTNTVSGFIVAGGTWVVANPVTQKVYVSGQSSQLLVFNEK